jgi:hypothetical protein
MAVDISDIELDQVYNFIKNGNPDNAPREIVDYLQAMDMVRGMYLRQLEYPTKEMIIKHLTKVEGMSYYLANKLYHNTIEYFYCSNTISKKAWNNLYADRLDDLAAIGKAMIKDARDAKAVAGIVKEARLARGLDQPDPIELPPALFEKPYIMYEMNSEFLGLPPIDRNKLAEQIDELPEMTEREKDLIKRDAAITQINIFPNEQENPRKQ